MIAKFLFISSQATQNIVFGLMLFVLSYLNYSELVIKYSLFFLLYSLIYPLIALRFEQKIFRIGKVNLDDCLSSVILICLSILCLLLFSAFFIDLENFSNKEIFLSLLLCWLFGTNFVLKQFLLIKKRILGISTASLTACLLIFALWLFSENKHLEYFLDISIILMLITNIFSLLEIRKCYILKFSYKKVLIFLKKNFLDSCKLTFTIFASVLSANFLVIIFSNIADKELASDLLIYLRILSLPISILAIPASQIFANELLKSNEKAGTLKIYFLTFFVIIALYNSFILVLPEYFFAILGIEKIILDIFFIALLIAIGFRSIVSPLTSGFNVLNKNLFFLLIQSVQLIGIICMYYFSSFFYDYYLISIGYALITIIYCSMTIILLNKFVKRNP